MTDRSCFWPCIFVLQLCLGGLGLQAWRLQQETLWFRRAGESHPHLIALFVFQRDCLVILLIPTFPACLSTVVAFLSSLLARTKNRGGLMSHDVLGVAHWCALPAWITVGFPVTVMEDSPASKVNLLCRKAVWLAVFLVNYWPVESLLHLESVYTWCMVFHCELSLYNPIAQRDRKSSCFARRLYFLSKTYWRSAHESSTLSLWLISLEEKPHVTYQYYQTDSQKPHGGEFMWKQVGKIQTPCVRITNNLNILSASIAQQWSVV